MLLVSHALPVYLITPIILVFIATAVTLGGVFIITYKSGAVEKIVGLCIWVTKKIVKNQSKQESIRQKLHHSLSSFSDVFKTFEHQPRRLIKPAIYAVISWVFNLVVYLMIFYSLNFTAISLVDLATVFCIVTTVETVTAGLPVGAVEVTMVNLFSVLGVPIAIAAAATTIARLLTYWCQVLVGYPLVNWVGAKSLFKGGLANAFSPKHDLPKLP